jgi:hypothetical protein
LKTGAAADIFDALAEGAGAVEDEARRLGGVDARVVMVSELVTSESSGEVKDRLVG